jgi:hypothetical protein
MSSRILNRRLDAIDRLYAVTGRPLDFPRILCSLKTDFTGRNRVLVYSEYTSLFLEVITSPIVGFESFKSCGSLLGPYVVYMKAATCGASSNWKDP